MIHEVGLLEPVATTSATGARQITYERRETCLAEVTENSSESARVDDNLSARAVLKFNAATVGGLTTEWKAEFMGRIYDIDSVTILGKTGIYSRYECYKNLSDETN
jgi:hypothetical protein